MIFIGSQKNFVLNRDGKRYEADNGVLDAPEQYAEVLKAYGFEPSEEQPKEAKGKKPQEEK